jgi:hypothetical protein
MQDKTTGNELFDFAIALVREYPEYAILLAMILLTIITDNKNIIKQWEQKYRK